MSHKAHLEERIYRTNRTYQELLIQRANYTNDTPVSLINAIRDKEEELENLQVQLIEAIVQERESQPQSLPVSTRPVSDRYPKQPFVIGTILVLVGVLIGFFIAYVIVPRDQEMTTQEITRNPLVTYFDFEGTTEGWSRIKIQELHPDTEPSPLPDRYINSELTTDYALTGQHSLKVTSETDSGGSFKSFVYLDKEFAAHGATIYVLMPHLPEGTRIEFVQVCSTLGQWKCSHSIIPDVGKWSAVTLDLNQGEGDFGPLSENLLDELAIQWAFVSENPTSFELYLDAGELFRRGEINE